MSITYDLAAVEARLKGRRVGVITTPAAWIRGIGSVGDWAAATLDVAAFLALEHGVRGELQDGVLFDSTTDARTGLPVYSYYGESHSFPPAVLDALDAVLFHVQDVTHRAYTYKEALAETLSACAGRDIEVIVLDRPTPLGFMGVNGPLGNQFFPLPLPVLPALTLGELGRYLVRESGLDVHLSVVPVQGWCRADSWGDTGAPWIPPSPNIPSLTSAYCYACTGCLQHTTLSEGRGTCKPFEYVGAPFVDGAAWARVLNELALPGVVFREVYFKPAFNTFAGQVCGGVHTMMTEPRQLDPIRTMLHVVQTVLRLHPGDASLGPGFRRWLDGSDWHDDRMRELDVDAVLGEYAAQTARFSERVDSCRLYPDGHRG